MLVPEERGVGRGGGGGGGLDAMRGSFKACSRAGPRSLTEKLMNFRDEFPSTSVHESLIISVWLRSRQDRVGRKEKWRPSASDWENFAKIFRAAA